MNGRGGVSEGKRRKVLAMARALGVRPGLPSPVEGPLLIDVLMPDSATDHFRRLESAFLLHGQRLHSRITLRPQLWPESEPARLLDVLRKPRARRHGLIVTAPDTSEVNKALGVVARSGTPTVLLTSNMSDLPEAVYVGIDNYAAGRSAGRLMSQWTGSRPGAVLLVVNSLLYAAHRERVKGFVEVMQKHAPASRIIGPVECFDKDALTDKALMQALDQAPLAGVYDTGSGSVGIQAALNRTRTTPVWIGHEASALHAELLRQGAMTLVLDQDPEGQVQASVDYLLHKHGVLDAPPIIPLAMKIIIDENLPRRC
jgi:LacI family transcriptional regulator